MHQGIMELFEVGGSNAVLLYLGGKSTLALGLQRKQQQQHRTGTCGSHEKTADLGHVRDQHLMLNANCPGFQHTQQKNPKNPRKNSAQIWMEGQNLHWYQGERQ